MLDIVAFELAHKDIIKNWGSYPDEFKELNYAIEDGGWIDEYLGKKDTYLFSAIYQDEIVGFSILSDDEYGTEFRIALSPKYLGKGFGKEITAKTIDIGFNRLNKNSIYLIVRLNNLRAKRLYENIGFKEIKKVNKIVNNKQVEFIKMVIKYKN